MDVHRPKVSIGMPVYNATRYLEGALDSILSQSFEDFEVIISDNASTDGTAEICSDYAATDDRIKYVRSRDNYGVIHNFNTVFRLSSGEYFKWAASDDICGRDYLLRAVEVLDEDPSVVLVWPKTVGIDESGDRVQLPNEVSDLNREGSVYSVDPAVRFRRLLRNLWWVDGPFYGVIRSRSLGETIWLHPPHVGGDQILLTELSLKGRFYEIPEELFFCRAHAQKTSRRHSTLRQRAALGDPRASGKSILSAWRLFRAYPQRILMYTRIISTSSIPYGKKVLCYVEVARAVMGWTIVRLRQVASGSSPWRRNPG